MISINRTPPPETPGTPTFDETAHTDPGPDPVSEFSSDPVSESVADPASALESVSDRGTDTSQDDRNWNDAEDRYARIAEAAYYKAEQRDFEIGFEQLDWLEAEQEQLEQMGEEKVY